MAASPTRPAPTAELPAARRRDARGLAVALAVHAALIVLALLGARAAAARFAESSRDADFLTSLRGGGGGGGSRAVYIGSVPSTRRSSTTAPPAPPAPVPPPVAPRAAPAVAPAQPPIAAPTPSSPAPVAADAVPAGSPGEGGGTGGGVGTGTGPGTGSGTGPGSGTGIGGGTGDGPIRAPVWRAGALPFEPPPKDLRGRTVSVTFWVRADGRVEKLEVRPPLPDGDYARRFEETLLGYRFQPARTAAGVAVAATTTLDIQLPSK